MATVMRAATARCAVWLPAVSHQSAPRCLSTATATAAAAAAAVSRGATTLVLSERLVLPGRDKEIAAILSSLAAAARAHAGFIGSRSFVDAENPARVVVVSEWTDAASWARWSDDPQRKRQIDALREHLFGPVTHRILTPHRGPDAGPVLV